MVFSSIPVYLDPPNWHQHQQQNQHEANVTNNPQLLPPLPPQGQAPVADRADQLAKISPPEIALKCPRCESTNTKFCYFNNYSLSQPRHFCKTCKRYWTRGGALRNVPVGGGCRINKKNNKRKSRSKSPSSTDDKHSSLSNSTSHGNPSPSAITPSMSNPPFMMASNYLQNMSHYGMGNISNNHMGFPIGVDQWRLQQFPNFLNGFESTNSAVSYPFQSESVEAPYGLVGDIALNSRVTHQLQPSKLEDLNLSRSHMSVSENNQYYSWSTNLSGPASSSTTHLL